jgi:hypothetical protein
MKGILVLGIALTLLCLVSVIAADAQETFTGNIISYGSGAYTGVRTGSFTLRLNRLTSDAQTQEDLAALQRGQDKLLDAIHNEDLGTLEFTGQLGRTINAAREVNVGGMRKIYVVFERWTQFAEIRGGYRSLDYPFGYMELTIDPSTGKGSGQYFAAAKIRWKSNTKEGVGHHIEIEDYATIPAKITNVRAEGMRR